MSWVIHTPLCLHNGILNCEILLAVEIYHAEEFRVSRLSISLFISILLPLLFRYDSPFLHYYFPRILVSPRPGTSQCHIHIHSRIPHQIPPFLSRPFFTDNIFHMTTNRRRPFSAPRAASNIGIKHRRHLHP